MDVYILDSLFRKTEVVDNFQDFIWTERYADVGDFEINIQSNYITRAQFVEGVHIGIDNSYRIMTVETINETIDSDGKMMLNVKGRSLEAIFEDRIIFNPDTFPADPSWNIIETPGNIMRIYFYETCIVGIIDTQDILPGVSSDVFTGFLPAGDILEPSDVITFNQSIDTLLNVIKNVTNIYDLGFRLILNPDDMQLYFSVYTGNDLSTTVVFAIELDNLQNSSYFKNTQGSKNICITFDSTQSLISLGFGVSSDVSGFERKVTFLDARSDVADDDPDPTTTLTNLGYQELQKYRAEYIIDGEINQSGNLKYGVDYNLGDKVQLRDSDDFTTYKLITEQIFVSDAEGDRSYPTLSIKEFTG